MQRHSFLEALEALFGRIDLLRSQHASDPGCARLEQFFHSNASAVFIIGCDEIAEDGIDRPIQQDKGHAIILQRMQCPGQHILFFQRTRHRDHQAIHIFNSQALQYRPAAYRIIAAGAAKHRISLLKGILLDLVHPYTEYRALQIWQHQSQRFGPLAARAHRYLTSHFETPSPLQCAGSFLGWPPKYGSPFHSSPARPLL